MSALKTLQQPHTAMNLAEGLNDAPISEPSAASPHALQLPGDALVGRLDHPRDHHTVHHSPHLLELLNEPQAPDIIVSLKNANATVVDVDTHLWEEKPSRVFMESVMSDVRPRPNIAWISHGCGLKLLYLGTKHSTIAGIAALNLPRDFEIEISNNFRHPRSTDTHRTNAKCGEVRLLFNTYYDNVKFFGEASLSSDEKRAALDRLRLTVGQRYDHDRCPIDPSAVSQALACVVVNSEFVHCFRCSAKGTRVSPDLPPGRHPLVSSGTSSLSFLETLARNRVHWTHALLDLRDRFSNAPEKLLKMLYDAALQEVMDDEPNVDGRGLFDPRLPLCFNPDLKIIRGESTWLDEATFAPTHVDNDVVNKLPHALNVSIKAELLENGQEKFYKKIWINTVRRAQMKYRKPDGYRAVRPYRGLTFLDA